MRYIDHCGTITALFQKHVTCFRTVILKAIYIPMKDKLHRITTSLDLTAILDSIFFKVLTDKFFNCEGNNCEEINPPPPSVTRRTNED